MTPDMKRLCETVIDTLPSRRLDEDDAYAIVRNVLEDLRKTDRKFFEKYFGGSAPGMPLVAEGFVVATIDHILAEPATA